MDHESLRTASSYLNNLLLARGLLRNSEAIDFVKPSRESRAQIINLVHDLILRDDKQRSARDSIASTLRSLQTENARKAAALERSETEKEEALRASVRAQTAERAAVAEVKKVERGLKGVQEQAAKTKLVLAQVRAQCATDVRKRDLELVRLKGHLQGQQRGNNNQHQRGAVAGPTMTVSGRRKKQHDRDGKDGAARSGVEVGDPEYTLQQETTEFLTQLSQSLSDENDGLIALVRGAVGTMRELLGLPSAAAAAPLGLHPDSAVGSLGSDVEAGAADKDLLRALPTSHKALAADVHSTLAHLKHLLTNPNFVPLHEVEVREEEIVRLREGWERMEERWKDVLVMMEGWRRKMDTGMTINLEDLRRGIGMVSPGRFAAPAAARGKPDVDSSLLEEESISEVQLPDVEQEEEEEEEEGEEHERVESVSSLLRTGQKPHSKGAHNGRSSSKRKRDLIDPPEFFDLRPTATLGAASTSPPPSPPSIHHEVEEEEVVEELADSEADDLPRLTIAEKLDDARAQAEQARARAQEVITNDDAQHTAIQSRHEQDDTLGKMMPSPMTKRTKIRGRPRRRKSTLSPEELEELLAAEE